MAIPINTVGALFAHVWFVPEGTSYSQPTAGTAGRESKPGAADSVWSSHYFGRCEDFKVAPETEEYEVHSGFPGGRIVSDIVELRRQIKVTFTAQEMHPLVMRMAFGTLALTSASAQANPLEGKLGPNGWLKFQAYNESHALWIIAEIWGRMKITNMESWNTPNIVKASFEFSQIRSIYNTIAFPGT